MSISDLQPETSEELVVDTIAILSSPDRLLPFKRLAHFVSEALLCDQHDNCAPLEITGEVNAVCSLSNNAHCLNKIMASLHASPNYIFTDFLAFESDTRYYEQIIFAAKEIPTRRNWHDFFNGLIWSQFPATKQYFNECHIREIESVGSVKKRTPQRDKLTHFDECGLVLFTNCQDIQRMMSNHNWQELFVDNRDKWHSSIVPIIFGHAVWEMALKPFLGLTAKATVILVDDAYIHILASSHNSSEHYALCDSLLKAHINNYDLINAKRPWLPLPVLGIPGWSEQAQTTEFYSNKAYFMPKR